MNAVVSSWQQAVLTKRKVVVLYSDDSVWPTLVKYLKVSPSYLMQSPFALQLRQLYSE